MTNLPRAGCSPDGHAAASLEEIVRLYGLRVWVEQGYKQVKHELGWADFQVRSAYGILRHLILVCCAFSFCWQASRTPDAQPPPPIPTRPPPHRGLLVGHAARWTPAASWPVALRRVRSWLTPWWWLQRLWRACAPPASPPPAWLPALVELVAAGRPLYLYQPP